MTHAALVMHKLVHINPLISQNKSEFPQVKVVYFASPMCSWCWGFAPVMQKIKTIFAKQIKLRLVLTPFRIDNTTPMDKSLRDYVLQQWYKVHHTTGQSFDFNFAMSADFIYNTKSTCLAIKAFSQQRPELELEFLNSIQAAFYTENLNVTNEEILVDLLRPYSVDIDQFIQDLHAKAVHNLLEEDFNFCKQLKVDAYPTLVGMKEDSITVLTHGYMPCADLEIKLKSWIRD